MPMPFNPGTGHIIGIGAPSIPIEDYTDPKFDDTGSFDPVTGKINDDLTDGFIQDIVTDPSSGEQTFIEHDSSIDNVINDALSSLGSSAKDGSAIGSYLDMFKLTGDSAWLEKYLDSMVARENVQSARDYETQMSNTSFSRMISDIKSAGYNPWLALQNNAASTPSISAAGLSNVSQSSQSTSKANQAAANMTDIVGRLITSIGFAAAMIIGKLILKA